MTLKYQLRWLTHSLIRVINDPRTLHNRLKESRLARFRKTRKHESQGNAELFLANATFCKTAIKPKFVDS